MFQNPEILNQVQPLLQQYSGIEKYPLKFSLLMALIIMGSVKLLNYVEKFMEYPEIKFESLYT